MRTEKTGATVVALKLPDFEMGMPAQILAPVRTPESDLLLRNHARILLLVKVSKNHDANISALRAQSRKLAGEPPLGSGQRPAVCMLTAETEEVVNAAIEKVETEKARLANPKKKRKRA